MSREPPQNIKGGERTFALREKIDLQVLMIAALEGLIGNVLSDENDISKTASRARTSQQGEGYSSNLHSHSAVFIQERGYTIRPTSARIKKSRRHSRLAAHRAQSCSVMKRRCSPGA